MTNRLISFFAKHWFKLVLGCMVLLSALMLFEKKSRAKQNGTQRDFIASKISHRQFEAGFPLDIDALDLLKRSVDKHRELHPLYDFALIESLFILGKADQSAPLTKAALQRVKHTLPPVYQHFAKTSQLLEEKQFGQALFESEALEQTLSKNPTANYETLRGYNLLRLVFLYKMSGEKQSEQNALNKLMALPVYNTIAPLFQEGDLTLTDFLSLK